ncbi:toxin-antitoxin system YwqK family antitoxin [Fusobacterium perfoetens]|uniref:toxin-antitoxin system YwqK family antitoxin n=1 Tax=Fusobacterium perfoetens TaxID=852 RepID=UPI00068474B1|nr:toxin-antitoxin system YwqK family antitoxin [Fusobacterium perfoetens]
MKVKIVLSVITILGIAVGTYIYQNKYSFYRYLPAEDESKLQSINFKWCDEDGKAFSGRIKNGSDSYLNIYSYKDGELDGLNVIYYKNKIKEIGHWKEGKQNGLFQMYTEDGILVDNANFKNGERDGLTEQYYSATGKLRIAANFKNGVLDGKYKAYYPSGALQGEVFYTNGEMNGEIKEYYENGNLRLVGNYKKSLENGEWKFYLEKGNLQSIVNYKDGEMNGLKEDYYDNGKVWTRSEFKNNIQEGIYEVYYKDGTPQLKAKIKGGKIIEEQRFNRDGTIYDENDDKVFVSETVVGAFEESNITENEEEITIKEVDDKGNIISESQNNKKETEKLEEGNDEIELLGETIGNAFNSMVETLIISNLVYIDLMSFEKIEISEEKLKINDKDEIPYKRNYKNGVYGVNIPIENNNYLWVQLKENKSGEHKLFFEEYKKFRENNEKEIRKYLEELVYPIIDDFYKVEGKEAKFFDITISIKNYS